MIVCVQQSKYTWTNFYTNDIFFPKILTDYEDQIRSIPRVIIITYSERKIVFNLIKLIYLGKKTLRYN